MYYRYEARYLRGSDNRFKGYNCYKIIFNKNIKTVLTKCYFSIIMYI